MRIADPMFALVYASAATTPFDDAALKTLAEKAGDKNRRLQITGYLNYTDVAQETLVL